MNCKRSERAQRDLPCAHFFDDDGPDGWDDRGDAASRQPDQRKLDQLCAQIRRALELTLNTGVGALPDHVDLVEVAPDPDVSRVRVTFSVGERCVMPIATLRAHLVNQRPALRASVAASIHRKRVPQLVFECIPRKESNDE